MIRWTRLTATGTCPSDMAQVLWDDERRVLGIWCRGTRGWREWVWNFLTRTRWASRGVRLNYRDYRQASIIFNVALGFILKAEKVHVYGASRGGAVAVCLMQLIHRHYPKKLTYDDGEFTSCIVFGAKRAGRIEPPSMVLANYHVPGDIVPFLPPWYSPYPNLPVKLKEGESYRFRPVRAHKRAMQFAAKCKYRLESDLRKAWAVKVSG